MCYSQCLRTLDSNLVQLIFLILYAGGPELHQEIFKCPCEKHRQQIISGDPERSGCLFHLQC